jgi:hypothetical protein
VTPTLVFLLVLGVVTGILALLDYWMSRAAQNEGDEQEGP